MSASSAAPTRVNLPETPLMPCPPSRFPGAGRAAVRDSPAGGTAAAVVRKVVIEAVCESVRGTLSTGPAARGPERVQQHHGPLAACARGARR